MVATFPMRLPHRFRTRKAVRKHSMKTALDSRTILSSLVLLSPLITTSSAAPQSPPAEDPEAAVLDWPKVYKTGKHEVVVFQPQIDSWTDYAKIEARAAVAVALDGAEQPIYGAMSFTASTKADFETRAVLIDDRHVQDLRFPNAPGSLASRLIQTVGEALPPKRPLQVPLDFVLANIERTEQGAREIEVNLAPPPIFHSESPAILVMFMDQPRLEAVDGTSLLFATNTNWDVFRDSGTSLYFLRNGSSWLQAEDPVAGPWGPAAKLPADLSKLPDDENWAEVKKSLPGVPPAPVPTVFTSTQPAELILTEGAASYSAISGTKLLYVTNSDSDLFLLSGADEHYFLTAGRWFRASSLDGPWTSATQDLPEDFQKIPDDHEKAHVLPSVPGTPEAEEAILQASIPRKVTVDRSAAKAVVVFDGDPEFVLIEGTTVYYAVNSPNDVFRVDGKYYCCYQAVWFVASSANGPWEVCSKVPAVIYQIPSSHPEHNVTYVYVYDSTPSTVVVGYTTGYVGVYPAYGVVMFGLGYWLAADHYHHHRYHDYHCHSHYYGYGGHAHYDHYSGTYYRGSTAYGPYGGAGRGAAYNPSTGTYHRGAYAYGPEGSRFAQQAYNPRTGARATRTGGSSPYGAWSRGVVTRGNEWARGGRATDGTRTAGGFETSRGSKGVGVSGPSGRAGAVRTRQGDVYVGKDGNIYKRENGQWQARKDGGWSKVDRTSPSRTPGTGRDGTAPGTPRSAGSDRPSPGSRQAGATSSPRTGRSSGGSLNRGLERDSHARSRGNRNSERFRSSGGRSGGSRRSGSRGGGRRGGGRRGG